MRVRVLGPLEVEAGGQSVEVPGARLRVLLIRLALDAGRVISAESLVQAVWGPEPPGDPGHALQALVSRLRRALPGPAALRSVPGGYLLDAQPEAVDAIRFEQLTRDGQRLLRAGQPGAAGERLRGALDLWRGEPLADAAQALFALPVITRLGELRLAAAEDLIAAELQTRGGNPGVVAELEALAAEHPLRERLRLLLIKALHADGRGAEALAVYESFRQLLAAELGTDPGWELRQAHLAVLRGDPLVPMAAGSRRGNLRMPLSSFVGREREQEDLAALIADRRLVTLTGPGGAGKTRLATTIAITEAAGAGCPGGAWLVELAAVTDPREVARAWAAALGLGGDDLTGGASQDSAARLAEALPATGILVILDNCEHLLDAVTVLTAELLGRCPGLRVLATSREPLGVPGEAVYPVPPLSVPGPEIAPEAAAGFPAVRLFADRAADTAPGFRLTAASAVTAAEICRRLDGLPLAIELATAWLRSLPLEELAARLGDRFVLLTTGSRTAPPRHQTLRAVVAWSWDLLDADERALAEALSVFPGGITPEAAEAVLAGRRPVLGLLAALVGKSLLQPEPGIRPRYRMLETIREFGVAQLAAAGRLAAARSAHAAYFTDLAETAEPRLRTGEQRPWLDALTAEQSNLLAALRHACDAGDAGTAVRLGAALGAYWTIRGEHGEAAAWLRQALAVPGRAPSPATAAATALWALNAVLCGAPGRAGLAARALRETKPGPAGHPVAALLVPALALAAGDETGGTGEARQPAHPDPWTRGMLCLIRSFLAANHADLAGSEDDLAAAAEEFRQAGDRWGLATSLTFLGYTRLTLGRFDDAAGMLAEAVRLLSELGQGDHAVMQRSWLAEALWRQGGTGQARTELLAIAGPGTAGTGRHAFLARKTLGDMARLDGDLAEAERLYRAAAGDLSQVPAAAVWAAGFDALLRSAMAHLATARGDLPAAREHIGRALAGAVPEDDMPLLATVAVAHARLRHAENASREAARLLGAAHALRGASDEFNPDVAALAAGLRGELGEAGFTAAYEAGRRLDRAAALAHVQAAGQGQVRRR